MDARQFDGLTKAIGSGANRRRVLGVLAGGLAAALGAQRATVAAECKKEGQRVKDKKACCSGAVDADDRCAACGCDVNVPCTLPVPCGDDPNCNCWVRADLSGCFCGPVVTCTDLAPCGLDDSCPDGTVCVENCCGKLCYPPCGSTPLARVIPPDKPTGVLP